MNPMMPLSPRRNVDGRRSMCIHAFLRDTSSMWINGCPSRMSDAASSTTQSISPSGKILLMASSAGRAWTTSPMADSFTISIRMVREGNHNPSARSRQPRKRGGYGLGHLPPSLVLSRTIGRPFPVGRRDGALRTPEIPLTAIVRWSIIFANVSDGTQD